VSLHYRHLTRSVDEAVFDVSTAEMTFSYQRAVQASMLFVATAFRKQCQNSREYQYAASLWRCCVTCFREISPLTSAWLSSFPTLVERNLIALMCVSSASHAKLYSSTALSFAAVCTSRWLSAHADCLLHPLRVSQTSVALQWVRGSTAWRVH
jgi:hypothetical protein